VPVSQSEDHQDPECSQQNGCLDLPHKKEWTWPQVGPLSERIRTKRLNPPRPPEVLGGWGASVASAPAERLKQPPAGGRHRWGGQPKAWKTGSGPWPPPMTVGNRSSGDVRDDVINQWRRASLLFSITSPPGKLSPEAMAEWWKGLPTAGRSKAVCRPARSETAEMPASYALAATTWPASVLAVVDSRRP